MTAALDCSVAYEQRYAAQAVTAAIDRREPEILLRGPRGVGKTIDLCDRFHRFAMQYPGMLQFWVRKTRTRLTDSVLGTFEDEILGPGHPLIAGQDRTHRHAYNYPNGSRIVLLGLDDAERGKSISGDLVWVNEPTEISEDLWEEIGASSRPRRNQVFPHSIKIGDFNPVNPAHWTNRRCPPFPKRLYPHIPDDGSTLGEQLTPEMYAEYTDFNFEPLDRSKHKAKLIVFCMPDNPGYWDLDPWGPNKLGLEYLQNRLGIMSGHRKLRYMAGEPCAAEGSVFPEFDESRNTCEPFDWPEDWPVIVGYDSGYDHPAAVVFYGIAPTEQPFIIDCIHQRGLTLEELGARIVQHAQGKNIVDWLADPRDVFKKTAHASGKTIADFMRERYRVHFRKWPAKQGEIVHNQVEAVRDLIRRDKNPLVVFRTCEEVISEFQSWAYKRTSDGSVPAGDDAFEDRNNDAMDAVLGIVATKPRFEPEKITVYGGGG